DGALHVAWLTDADPHVIKTRLTNGEEPGSVLGLDLHTLLLTTISQVQMDRTDKELTVVYVKGTGSEPIQVVATFADGSQVEVAFAALQHALGTGWQVDHPPQSIWKAARWPCEVLFGMVGMPLILMIAGMLGGETDLNWSCLLPIAVIILVAVGVIYL